MGLCPELQGYAENIWRRFPELFISLGSPDVEENFELQDRGAGYQRVVHTSSKSVFEIVLPRRLPVESVESESDHLIDVQKHEAVPAPLSSGRHGFHHCSLQDPLDLSPSTSVGSSCSNLAARRGIAISPVDTSREVKGVVTRVPELDRPGNPSSVPKVATALTQDMLDTRRGLEGDRVPASAKTSSTFSAPLQQVSPLVSSDSVSAASFKGGATSGAEGEAAAHRSNYHTDSEPGSPIKMRKAENLIRIRHEVQFDTCDLTRFPEPGQPGLACSQISSSLAFPVDCYKDSYAVQKQMQRAARDGLYQSRPA